jgi:hypothetical protein
MIKCEFEDGNVAKPGLRHLTTGVLVLRDGKLLLAKRAEGLLEAGKWGVDWRLYGPRRDYYGLRAA